VKSRETLPTRGGGGGRVSRSLKGGKSVHRPKKELFKDNEGEEYLGSIFKGRVSVSSPPGGKDLWVAGHSSLSYRGKKKG